MDKRRLICRACQNIRRGIKTRLPVEHTCSENPIIIRRNIEEAREQYEKDENDRKVETFYNHL